MPEFCLFPWRVCCFNMVYSGLSSGRNTSDERGWEGIREKDYFSEFTLMIVATLGAFYIGEYPEGVAVMLFYTIGELFQNKAVDRAKRNIGALLDVRPEKALVLREDNLVVESPQM